MVNDHTAFRVDWMPPMELKPATWIRWKPDSMVEMQNHQNDI